MSQFLSIVTFLGVPLMALTGIGCLLFGRGENRKRLLWAAAVLVWALTLWIGGDFVLKQFGLAWRSGTVCALCVVLLADGLIGLFLTLSCFLPMERPGVPSGLWYALKGVAVFFSVAILVVVLWFGPFGLMFIFGNTERVVELQGETLLEVDDGFMDPHYSYYVYHGPLVRGRELVGESWGD